MVGIKCFEMPNSCYDCDLCYDLISCSIVGVDWEPRYKFDPDKERSKNCPLIEIVECKDCVAWNKTNVTDLAGKCQRFHKITTDIFFCKAGVRRDDDGQTGSDKSIGNG